MGEEVLDGVEVSRSANEKLKLCIHCFQSIHANALRCHHCSSFQDWRRKLNLSNTLLALLVAFVSVSTVAVQTVSSVTQKKYSKTEVMYVGSQQATLSFSVFNEGNRSAIIDRIQINFETEDAQRSVQTILMTGTFSVFPDTPLTILAQPILVEMYNDTCDLTTDDLVSTSISVELQEYKKPRQQISLPLSIDEFELILSSTKQALSQAQRMPNNVIELEC